MLESELLAECLVPPDLRALFWRGDTDGTPIALRITVAGVRAIGLEADVPADIAPGAQSAAPSSLAHRSAGAPIGPHPGTEPWPSTLAKHFRLSRNARVGTAPC